MSYVLLQDAGGILAAPGWHCSGDSSPSGGLAANVFFYIHIYIVYIYIGIKSFERYFVEDQHGFIQPFSKF